MEQMLIIIEVFFIIVIILVGIQKIFQFYMVGQSTKAKTEIVYNNLQMRGRKKILDKQGQEYLDLINYKENVEPFYLYARDLFNSLMKQSRLNKNQILFLQKIIDDSLGDYHELYKNKPYKNDYHEIHSKLKSKHISVEDFERIILYLEKFTEEV